MTKRTAFVTGASGFLGLNLVEALHARGWDVIALHRKSSPLGYLDRFPVHKVEGDICDGESVLRAMPAGIDTVFHVAGSINLWRQANAEQFRINVEGTRHMVRAALARRVRKFVHTSSISVYGLQHGRIREDAEKLGRISWINYQRTKYLAEEEVQKGIGAGLDATMLNPASILGPYDTRGWARLIVMAHRGTLPGVPPGSASFCDVGQVALAHIAAADRGGTGENYLLGGADHTYVELLQTVGEVMGKSVPNRATPVWLMKTAAHTGQWLSRVTGKQPRLTPEALAMVSRQLFCDSTKAQKELGFRPIPLRKMVQDSYNWLARENLL